MKYYILFFLSFLFVFLLVGQNRFNKEGISLNIKESPGSKNILICSFKNVGSDTLITDQFNASVLNKLVVFSPLKEKLTDESMIFCHNRGYISLFPNDQREWEYNIENIVNPNLYVSRKKLPKGQYEVYWIVNGIQSASFFYEKL